MAAQAPLRPMGDFSRTAAVGRYLTFDAWHLKVCLLEAAIQFPIVKGGSRPIADIMVEKSGISFG